MSISYFNLADNRLLGITIFEVVSFPSAPNDNREYSEYYKNHVNEFHKIITECYQLAGSDFNIEILWIGEKVEKQAFSSRIRIFYVLRKIGDNKDSIQYELENICQNLMISIKSAQYIVKRIGYQDDAFQRVVSQVNCECTYAIIKGEKCKANSRSIYPYYFTDIIPGRNYSNFSSLIANLSHEESWGVSFQLFPTKFSKEENYLINEVAGELRRIVDGIVINREVYKDPLAEDAYKVYSYYNERQNTQTFTYNMLVFGKKSVCASLATKIISHLKNGDEKVVSLNPTCIDISKEKICLSKHLPYYVWNINNKLIYSYRNINLQRAVPLAKNLFRLPYIVSADEASSFFRLPMHEKNMISLRSNQLTNLQEQLSEAVVSDDNIHLGNLIMDSESIIRIGCSEKSFTKHALIVGTPGSGKTTFSINLLLQFAKKGIPFMAIEPTKTEYRAMIDSVENLQIFTPGKNSVSPYIINPFIPPKGITIEQYIPSLASAFKAAFSMPSPLDVIFLKAIRTSYIKYGWKDYSKIGDKDVELFGLYEFIVVFKELIANTNYSKDVRGNIESAGILRLTNLIEQNSNIYDTINTVPIEDLLTKPTVLELNAIDNAEQKSLIMALLLINICIYTKHNQRGDGELKNAILIDEAHVLLGNNSSPSEGGADSQATTVKALQDMIAEIRSYGTSIIIADQSPTKVSREIIANTDIKVSFRLVQAVEKELIADSTNMTDENREHLSRLKPGEAYVYYSQLEAPQFILTEDIRKKEGIRLSVLDEEVAERTTYWKDNLDLLRPYRECKYCVNCNKGCDFKVRANAEYLANYAFSKFSREVKNNELFRRCVFHLPKLMKKEFDDYVYLDVNKLQMCTKIKLIRKIMLELPVNMTEKEKSKIIRELPNEKKEE